MNRSLIQYEDGRQEWLEDSERGLEPLAEGECIYISKAARMQGHGWATVVLNGPLSAAWSR